MMVTPAPVSLGITSSIASKTAGDEARAGRKRRWKLLEGAGELLPNEMVSQCCKHPIPGTSGVPISYSAKRKSANYRNLFTCGSVWMCPVCGAKISEGRRAELSEAVSRTTLTKVMVTFTLQHDRNDRLTDLRTALNDAYRRLKSGRIWQDFKADYGLVASVAATEITWGKANGWHIHKHVLFFSSVPEASFDVGGFTAALVSRYTGILDQAGRYASDLYGVKVQLGDRKAGDYVSKWGLEHEITKANLKKGRAGYSPFELLELYQEGKSWAGVLFREYALAMKGRHQLEWSRGGRAALGLGAEQTDLELAAAEEDKDDVVLAVLDFGQFQEVIRRRKRGELLEVAARGDVWQLWKFLERECGVHPTRLQARDVILGR
jgi:hypothetical protein